MTDHLKDLEDLESESDRDEPEQMGSLVTKALGLLAAKRIPTGSQLSEHFMLSLRDALLSEDGTHRRDVLKSMREAQIPVSEIIDHYIPEVSRRLGMDWHENRRSFADVTIGTARLQGLLRELSEFDTPVASSAVGAPGVAVIVREGEFHTLGAMVLSQQIRRHGVSVQLIVGQSDSDIVQTVARDQFDAVLLSVSRVETLDSLKRLVDQLRDAILPETPIIAGGSVVEKEEKALALTGADHIAVSATDALLKCGLKISLNGARPRAMAE